MVVNRNPNLIPRKSFPTLSPGHIRNLLTREGLDEKQSAAITAALTSIFNKFGVDERLNYDVIEKYMGQPRGGGQHLATVHVASSDSPDIIKNNADYVSTGGPTEDQATMDSALDDIPVSGGGILMIHGVFEADVDLTSKFSGVWVLGSGVSAAAVNNVTTGDGSGITISDLEINGNVYIGNNTDIWIQRNMIEGIIDTAADGEGYADPTYVHIVDNNIYGGTVYGLMLRNGAYLWVTDNSIDAGIYAAPADGSRIYGLNLHNNFSEGSLNLEELKYLNMTGNTFQSDCYIRGAGEDDLACIIASNQLSISTFEDCIWTNIVGNTIETNAADGVVFINCQDVNIGDNTIQGNSVINVPGSMVYINGDCERLHIHGNMGRCGGGKPQNFIEIGTGAADCKVWGNDGFNAWTVAAVVDNGTGTDLTSANR